MLLVFPPVAKPCEPPAGIARLAGALAGRGITHRILDANLEGLLYLLHQPQTAADTWTRRAVRNLPAHLAALRDTRTYSSPARYGRAVKDVNRLLAMSGRDRGAVPGLTDYQDLRRSPLRSADLIAAAEHPRENPFYGYFSGRLADMIEKAPSPSLVGFSLNYLSQALTTFAMIGFVRERFPGQKIVLGGGLVTSWMRRPGWRNPFGGLADVLIPGPGEAALLELLGAGSGQGDHAAPAYASLARPEYLSPGLILPYSGSSGCYWSGCSFCPETAEDNPYVPVPAVRAAADLAELSARERPALVHLLDNAVSPALMSALIDRPPGVPWYGFARIGRELADPAFCLSLRRSGCAMLKLGLESGDQAVLDRLGKGIDLEIASQALRNLRTAGIATYVYLLFGTPAESAAEARATLDFVAGHRAAITYLNLAIFNMPVCSNEAGTYGTGRFSDGDLSLYTPFRHPRGWGRKEVRLFLDREFKRHPAISTIIRRDPPHFTSNHAAFFPLP